MRLASLAAAVPEELRVDFPDSDPVVRGIAYDSRSIAPGDVFFALRGADADGHDYLEQALELGLIDELGGLRAAVRIAKDRLDLAPDDDVSLVPYPRPQSVADQVSEALGRLALQTVREPALSAVERRLEQVLLAVGETGPLLLPPLLAEIR